MVAQSLDLRWSARRPGPGCAVAGAGKFNVHQWAGCGAPSSAARRGRAKLARQRSAIGMPACKRPRCSAACARELYRHSSAMTSCYRAFSSDYTKCIYTISVHVHVSVQVSIT